MRRRPEEACRNSKVPKIKRETINYQESPVPNGVVNWFFFNKNMPNSFVVKPSTSQIFGYLLTSLSC
jgi:hypothetical protein